MLYLRFVHLFLSSSALLVLFALSASSILLTPQETSAAALSLAWNANQEPDLAGYRLYIGSSAGVYDSSVDVGSATTYQVSNLQAGNTYYFAVRAYDTSSNFSFYSSEVQGSVAVVDTTPPTIGAVTSVVLSTSRTITVSYSGVSDLSGIQSVALWARINGSGWFNTGQTRNTAAGSFTYTGLGDGTFYFGVVATDTLNNSSATPTGVGSTATIVDSIAPVLGTASSPASVTSTAITVSYSGISDGSGSGLSSVQLWVKTPSGSWSNTGQSRSTASGSFSYTAGVVGTYAFSLVARDVAGNTSAVPTGAGLATTTYALPAPTPTPTPTPTPAPVPTDLCPNDSAKTVPGVCGCGVVEDIGDNDSDGQVNCLDADDDNDGLSDSEETREGTNPRVADSDKDGINDGQEVAAGTDPLDQGSVVAVIQKEVCTEWNGFLGQLWNIIELVNMSSNRLTVRMTMRDSSGVAIASDRLIIAAGAQKDLLVHDLQARQADQYGLFCLSHNGQAGDLDGRMVYYKGTTTKKSKSFDFAFAMPFSNGLKGNQYVTYNTYQPSFRSEDQANLVANWIQLTNLSATKETGTLVFYDMQGGLLGFKSVSVNPNQRIDFSGHQYGPNHVGVVSWVPTSQTAVFQLRNVRYLYDNPNGDNSFMTAFQVEGAHPSGAALAVPLTLETETSIVEVVNVLATRVDARVDFYDEFGALRATRSVSLAAKNSIHIIANELMGSARRGLAVIKGNAPSSIIAVGMQYGRDATGGIVYMYGLQAKSAVGDVLKNTYNTYLNQVSTLALSNPTATDKRVTLAAVRSDGTRVVSNYVVSVPAHGIAEVRMNDLTNNNEYGVITITPESRNSVVAWIKRSRAADYVIPTPSR